MDTSTSTTSSTIVILDFGSQYTQLIARRIREFNVFSVVIPCTTPLEKILALDPRGIILSGGPSSVYDADAPAADPAILEQNLPVLGICYGLQFIAHHLGGKVVPSDRREYGHAEVEILAENQLFRGLPQNIDVWMSHGDEAQTLPEGFTRTAQTSNALAGIANEDARIWAVQFHPEVAHTRQGMELLKNFCLDICGAEPNWTPEHFIQTTVERVRAQVGNGHAICGLSGGVDSSVAAVLVARAIGDRLTCIFVNNGVLRKDEFYKVQKTMREQLGLNVVAVDAAQRFLDKLAGITDPERKRKIIGNEFIAVFDDEAKKIFEAEKSSGEEVAWLVQGTLYPDVIESSSVHGPSHTIKSHHNVGGLPEDMKLKLIEPLRDLFKDEVRRIGRDLGMPADIIDRQPFPGPGLAVRILGEVTPERVAILQEADEIVVDEIKKAGLYKKVWQSFAVLLPVKSVGVMGDQRTYANTCAIRAVESEDGMTADWAPLPYEVLRTISSRIVSEVRGINRVVYDITSKPPGTIEWE
ncbi:GMP synthase (glutamine-hydrolysing) [Granulicella pectinivorans]|uniref:GMP synthase [glutamine-hydrolyzing] n=1 Tax=Granulicella pectinivorans TaxID=474950 RepID=A0A1I6M6V3_9BACT|nr:glutamine-hydrolyzing GMP synthase [Granulicella pectinivorans]SFS11450.1 GMP synthase (glutamine-hydrolysing) [Granulicella pectinivorans]